MLYSLRVLDVRSGELLVDAIRERTSGGYLAIKTRTYPAELQEDLVSVLASTR